MRNLQITLFYHQAALALSQVIGGPNMTWFAFATWASRVAGGFIRGDAVSPRLRALGPLAERALEDLAAAVAEGNTMVFEELAPLALDFLDGTRRDARAGNRQRQHQ